MRQSQLDILLDAFYISGKDLATILHVDCTLVSKWRTGKRKLKPNSNYLKRIVSYFITLDSVSNYTTIESLLQPDYEKTDFEAREELPLMLKRWLLKESDPFQGDPAIYQLMCNSKGKSKTYVTFSGKDGRRDAVSRFLDIALVSSPGQELWLDTQESAEWFTEQTDFLNEWYIKNLEILLHGNSIRIIHPVDRQYRTLAFSLFKWLPLHMTGQTFPYYVPQYLNIPIKTTLFLLRGKVLLFSFSVDGTTQMLKTFVFTDDEILQEAYRVLQTRVQNSFSLFLKYNLRNNSQFCNDMSFMAREKGNQYFFTSTPVVFLLPEPILLSILQDNQVAEYNQKLCIEICAVLRQHTIFNDPRGFYRFFINYSQIQNLLKQPEIVLESLSFYSGKILYVSNQVFRSLLQEFLNDIPFSNENCQMGLLEKDTALLFPDLNLYVKENTSACVFSTNYTLENIEPLALMTQEPSAVTSLYLSYDEMWNKLPPRSRDQTYVREKLIHLIQTVFPE